MWCWSALNSWMPATTVISGAPSTTGSSPTSSLCRKRSRKQIADRLKLNLTGADKQRNSARTPLKNPEAYQLYLKGRYFSNKMTLETIQKGIEFFKQAIDKDPAYALAYAGLLNCYTYINVPVEARKAAVKALELDPTLAKPMPRWGSSNSFTIGTLPAPNKNCGKVSI